METLYAIARATSVTQAQSYLGPTPHAALPVASEGDCFNLFAPGRHYASIDRCPPGNNKSPGAALYSVPVIASLRRSKSGPKHSASAMPANPHFHRDESFYNSDSPSNMPSLTPASTLGSSHNASPADHVAGEDVLEDSLFPQLKSDEPNDVEELQKEDPLGVDVWKFYRKQSQLPDAERMQNMTWRMMTINLRKAQRGKSK